MSRQDRDRFIARRWFVRRTLAEDLRCDPGDVAILQECPTCGGPHGRPRVSGPSGREVFASWSSCGDLVVVATARAPVGVDVVGSRDLVDWGRLEATLKATGVGLTVDPSVVELSTTRVRRWRGPGRRPVLRLATAPLPDGAVVAIACLGRRRIVPVTTGIQCGRPSTDAAGFPPRNR